MNIVMRECGSELAVNRVSRSVIGLRNVRMVAC